MEQDEFAQFGGSAIAEEPDEFAAFGGKTVSAPAPAAPRSYLDALNAGEAPLADTPEAHYEQAKTFFDQSPAGRMTDSVKGALGNPRTAGANVVRQSQDGLGGMLYGAYEGAMNAAQESANASQKYPFTGGLRTLGSLALGGVAGLRGLANTAENGLDKLNLVDPTSARAWGGEEGGRARAYADFEQRKTSAALQASSEKLAEATGMPATFRAGEAVLPFAVPIPGLGPTAGLSARIGRSVGAGVEGAMTGAVGNVASHAISHSIGGGHGVGGWIRRAVVRPVIDVTAPALGRQANQAVTAGLNTATPIATGAAFGLANAPAGMEGDSMIQGAAAGAGFAPLTVYSGTFARQGLNEAAAARRAATRGMVEYGNDPVTDAATDRSIKYFSPEEQRAIFEQRGILREFPTRDGRPVQIQVPDDYAARATGMDGAPATAGQSEGFYDPQRGQVMLNPDMDAAPGKLREVLGHETGHAYGETALETANPSLSTRLTEAVANDALDANLQPKPGFQTFVDTYASKANGKPTVVDWNALGLEDRNYFLREYQAEVVRAAAPSVGKMLAGRELSDRIGDFGRGIGMRLGLRAAPSATAIFGPDSLAVPIGASALGAARNGLFAIGARANEGMRSPVRIAAAEPAPVANNVRQPAAAAQSAGTSPLAESLASQAEVPTYQGTGRGDMSAEYGQALAVATASKEFGGMGMSNQEAVARLDAAEAAGATEINDFLYHARTGRLPTERISIPPRPSATPPGRGTTPATEVTPEAAVPQPAGETAGEVVTNPPSQLPQTEGNLYSANIPISGDGEARGPLIASYPEGPLSRDAGQSGVSSNNAESASQSLEISSPEPTTPAAPAAIPFTADDVARINGEVAASFRPAPYKPRGTPAERAAKIAAKAQEDLAAAQREAVWRAHAETLPLGDNRVRFTFEPETNRVGYSGSRLVEGDPLHEPILAQLAPEQRAQLTELQDALATGRALNLDYFSAARQRIGEGTTAEGRAGDQAASTASARAEGRGAGELQKGKEFFPQSVSVAADGSILVTGFSPDKLIGNANKTIDLFNRTGREVPYADVNDPQFIADVAGYGRNHNANTKGDGSAPLRGTDAFPVGPVPEGYEPYILSKDKADFINIIMAQEGAKTPLRGQQVSSQRIQEFARANGLEPSEAGEVNALRQAVNDAGDFTVGDKTGTKAVLETPRETVRLDNIVDLRQSQGEVADPSNLRAQGFRGARGELTRDGTPSFRAASAGFLPSITRTREQASGLRQALETKARAESAAGRDVSDLTNFAGLLKGGNRASIWSMMRSSADENRFLGTLQTLADKYRLDLSSLESDAVKAVPQNQAALAQTATFAEQLSRVVGNVPESQRVGDQGRVYISDVYDAYKAQGGKLDMEAFKAELNRAHQAGEVTLSRKDLGTNDPQERAKIQRSETERLGESFHLIRP